MSTEENKTVARFFAFLLAVIPTSSTVAFAAFFGSWPLLALGLLPSIITMAISIVPTPVRASTILFCGVASFLISSGIMVYSIISHYHQVEYYMPVPFEYFDQRKG